MLKKLLFVFVVTLSLFFMVSCDKDPVEVERTYKADGVYTAFQWELHSNNGPQVSSVSVTIKNDKIESFYIDCIQNTKTETETTDAQGVVTKKTTYAFNAKTKKELGYEYGMHKPSSKTSTLDEYKAWLKANNKLEWFEQAALIEEFFKTTGPDKITVDATSKAINNITGVTVKDGGYSKLALEAIQLAKEGKAQAWIASGTDVIFATAQVDKDGKFTSLQLNTIQGKVVEHKWVWNEKTKQELGYDYAMHKRSSGTTTLDEYKAWLKANNKLEWFEQANIVTDYVLANGINDKFALKEDGKIDTSKADSALSGVTITSSGYKSVLTKLYANFK